MKLQFINILKEVLFDGLPFLFFLFFFFFFCFFYYFFQIYIPHTLNSLEFNSIYSTCNKHSYSEAIPFGVVYAFGIGVLLAVTTFFNLCVILIVHFACISDLRPILYCWITSSLYTLLYLT